MLERIKEILAEQLSISEDEISADSRIKEDLGADSLDVLQFLMAFEDEYGVTIPDEKLAEIQTVQNVIDYLEEI